MTFEVIVALIVTIIILGGLGYAVFIYLRDKTLEEIRNDVYGLFLKAEHMYKESGQGKQKLKWVVFMARKLLPTWSHKFITEKFLTEVIDIWFQGIKDLLDDGKVNASVK